MFGASFFHPAKSCEILKKLDSGMITTGGFTIHTIILGYFFYSLSKGEPPAFVYAIIIIIFILDLSFAVILGLQWQGKRCFRPYVNGEIAFIILSFTSKNLLAWINFFGGSR